MSERAMLLAIEQHIQDQDEFRDWQVAIEPDEQAPSITGELYVACMPAGVTAGPTHKTSGHVVDEIYTFGVFVVMRLPRIPRDKTRRAFIEHGGSLFAYMKSIRDTLDFDEDVRRSANTIIGAEEGAGLDGFIYPLKWVRHDPRPRIISSTVYAAADDQRAGLGRTMYFETRRVEARENL